ncbi:MAG: alpha/beta fold hydrolase [Bacteroidota bacterium]
MTTIADQMKQSAWFDQASYPFTARYFDHPDGQMHYVDEGEGEVLVFVHGTPSWSYLYRQLIRHFSHSYRCISLDHLGFGLSEKPQALAGKPRDHSRRLEALLDHLNIESCTLVVHDFGGPIGLSWALRQPERIEKLVLFNTWLWSLEENKTVVQADRIIRSALGRFLYLRMNASPRLLLPQGFANKSHLTKALHRHYLKVVPSATERFGLLRLGESLLGEAAWYETQWAQRENLAGLPIAFLWGEQDRFFGLDELNKWQSAFPQAETHTFKAGHFLQEECPEEIIAVLSPFLEKERL